MKKIIIVSQNQYWNLPIFKTLFENLKKCFKAEEVEVKIISLRETDLNLKFFEFVKILTNLRSIENVILIESFSENFINKNILDFIKIAPRYKISLVNLENGKLFELKAFADEEGCYAEMFPESNCPE